MATTAKTATAAETARPRITGIDVLRGAVMVLMAIDHVRVYSGVPAGGPSPGVFFTRWVTHFCAPVFVFLAGTSAFLFLARTGGQRAGDRGALARYLVSRGLLLVLLELTIIRASWTFGFDYSSFLLAGVIWMIGWCMVLLAALVWLPPAAVAAIGVLVIVIQPVFGLVARTFPAALRPWWELIYPNGTELVLGANGPHVTVLYVLVPWIGVMAAGYGFGAVFARPVERWRRLCVVLGLSMIALFLLLAVLDLRHPGEAPWLFRLLNQRKYPASVAFLSMTLGPAIALLPLADRARGVIGGSLETFGRVPFFYYLLHIPLIHAIALIVWRLRGTGVDNTPFRTAPYVQIADGQRWELWLLYAVWAIVVAILFVACRWYAALKARSSSPWLRYL
jgi:uncharacterized membrane protein